MTDRLPVFDPSDPGRSAPALVNHRLRRLGLGERYGPRGRVLPEGIGWCRALPAAEEAWPPGALWCVLVDWYPDAAQRRDPDTGAVPPTAAWHWRDRTTATITALTRAGFVAQLRGPRRDPHHHPRAELVVHQLPPGGTVAQGPPHGAWDAYGPAEPHFRTRLSGWEPTLGLRRVIADAGLRMGGRGTGDSVTGLGCVVRDITQSLWPEQASECGLVLWYPHPDPPDGAELHWRSATDRVRQALDAAGYRVRRRERPWQPGTDQYAAFLAHRIDPAPPAPATPHPPEVLRHPGQGRAQLSLLPAPTDRTT
ncbi:hypothetical protein [Kitasatospora sp. NPDC092286]|uniref:hypothetical protein n=1 Tax=Kitasatospora sp. NPDC092286 TaxID=3364087 RepID=UPI00381D24E2